MSNLTDEITAFMLAAKDKEEDVNKKNIEAGWTEEHQSAWGAYNKLYPVHMHLLGEAFDALSEAIKKPMWSIIQLTSIMPKEIQNLVVARMHATTKLNILCIETEINKCIEGAEKFKQENAT